MNSQIISRASQIIMENRLGHKLPKTTEKVDVDLKDSIHISSAAVEASRVSSAINQDDDSRNEKVQELKQSIEKGDYQFTDQMIDKIAKSIARVFIA